MSFDIRPLEAHDRAAWEPLWAGYLSFYETDLAPPITDLTWRRFHDPAEPVHALGAFEPTDPGALVGICHYVFHRSTWSASSYCYLADLFTAPAVRGTGAGRALIEATADAARDAGAEMLHWQTHTTNATARALYDQVAHHDGFVVYERGLAAT